MIHFFNLNRLCKGHSAIRATAVVQLGLAINFFPLANCCTNHTIVVSCQKRQKERMKHHYYLTLMLISGMTKGTSGSIRKALELSITVAPSFPSEIALANSLENLPSTARNTTSHERASSNCEFEMT